MAKKALYGIQSIKVMNATTDGSFPDFDSMKEGEDGLTIKAISKDSFTFNDSAPSENNIEVEEVDLPYATINTDDGTKQFQFESYDMSEASLKYLLGYTETTATGTAGDETWLNAPTDVDLKIVAVQVTTRKTTDFPACVLQWAKVKMNATRTGTLGKSGLPSYQFTFTEVANTDADGNIVSNSRHKSIGA